MSTTPAQVDLWISTRSEHQNLEFKAAKNSFDTSKLYRYCVAIANEGGGTLILGVQDSLPRKVTGTNAFPDLIGMASKLFHALGFRVNLEEVNHPDGRVVIFHIPARPHGTAFHYEGAYLMRSGEQLVPMSEDRLRGIFNEGKPDWSSQTALGNCSGADVVRLLDTQIFFDRMEIPYPTNQQAVLSRFESEKLIESDAAQWSIKNLGAILFAKDLNEFDLLRHMAARITAYDGAGKIATRSDNIIFKGYAVAFEELVNRVSALSPSNEVISNALRMDTEMFPKIAIRELIGNAIVHQDFNERGSSVRIELFDDRLEVSNPGTPLIPTDRFIDEYKSRNESMADLMRRMRIFEGKSSGVDKVVHAAEVYQLPAPDFRVGHGHTTAVLFGHLEFENMDRDARIRACYQHCSLRWVMNRPTTNQSLRERFKLDLKQSETASRILRETMEEGKIKVADPTASSTRYRSYIPFWA